MFVIGVMILFSEIISGCVIYICVWILLGIIVFFEGEAIWDILLMVPLGILMFSVSFFIVMIIVALVFSIIIRVK